MGIKSQIGFELYFSISAFVLVVAYLFFQLLKQYPAYLNQVQYEILKAEAYQLSEILVNDPGEPANWEPPQTFLGSVIWWIQNIFNPNTIKRIGLNDETENKTNLISKVKAETFNYLCNLYPERIQKWLDTNRSFAIYLKDNEGNVLISCNTLAASQFVISVHRVVAISSGKKTNYGELILELS